MAKKSTNPKKKSTRNTAKSGNNVKKKAVRKSAKKDDCFITTACVEYFNLEDGCFELELLRSFRENYLLKSIKGRKLNNQYKIIAPSIVLELKKDPQISFLIPRVFKSIQQACDMIILGRYSLAIEKYFETTFNLMSRYNLSL